jgi:hypothetical protein
VPTLPSALPKIVVRASEERIAAWKAAAGDVGLSAWAAAALDHATGAEVVVVQPVTLKAQAKPKRAECPNARFHREGSFCKSCGDDG